MGLGRLACRRNTSRCWSSPWRTQVGAFEAVHHLVLEILDAQTHTITAHRLRRLAVPLSLVPSRAPRTSRTRPAPVRRTARARARAPGRPVPPRGEGTPTDTGDRGARLAPPPDSAGDSPTAHQCTVFPKQRRYLCEGVEPVASGMDRARRLDRDPRRRHPRLLDLGAAPARSAVPDRHHRQHGGVPPAVPTRLRQRDLHHCAGARRGRYRAVRLQRTARSADRGKAHRLGGKEAHGTPDRPDARSRHRVRLGPHRPIGRLPPGRCRTSAGGRRRSTAVVSPGSPIHVSSEMPPRTMCCAEPGSTGLAALLR